MHSRVPILGQTKLWCGWMLCGLLACAESSATRPVEDESLPVGGDQGQSDAAAGEDGDRGSPGDGADGDGSDSDGADGDGTGAADGGLLPANDAGSMSTPDAAQPSACAVAGQTDCSGVCVDVTQSSAHCGTCGHLCPG